MATFNPQVFRFVAAMKKAGVKPELRKTFAEIIALVIGDSPAARAVVLPDVLPREVKEAFADFGFSGAADPKSLILEAEEYAKVDHLLEMAIFLSSATAEVFEDLASRQRDPVELEVWAFLVSTDPKLLERLYEVYSPFGKNDKPSWSRQAEMLLNKAPRPPKESEV